MTTFQETTTWRRSPRWRWTSWPAPSCSRSHTNPTPSSTSGWVSTGRCRATAITTPATLSNTPSQRPGHRRGGGDEDPELLRDVGHGDHGAGDREAGRGHEDTHQRDQQAPHWQGRINIFKQRKYFWMKLHLFKGWRIPMRVPRRAWRQSKLGDVTINIFNTTH